MSKQPNLEQQIIAALNNPNTGSTDWIELIKAVETGIAEAEATVKEERAKAIDLIATPDVSGAHERIIVGELKRDRLQTILPRLQDHLADAKDREYAAKWNADYSRAKEQQDALAKEFSEVFQTSVATLVDLYQRMAACDAECNRVNLAAPAGDDHRLRGPELTARGLQSFSTHDPSLVLGTKLPDWQDSRHAIWPPPQPSGVERYLAPCRRRCSTKDFRAIGGKPPSATGSARSPTRQSGLRRKKSGRRPVAKPTRLHKGRHHSGPRMAIHALDRPQ